MNAALVQIRSEASRQSDDAVARISEFIGLEIIGVSTFAEAFKALEQVRRDRNGQTALAIGGATACALFSGTGASERHLILAERQGTKSLVYGIPDGDHSRELLGTYCGTNSYARLHCLPPGPRAYQFHGTSNDSPLSSLGFECVENIRRTVFACDETTANTEPLVTLNGNGLLICLRQHSFTDYLLSEPPAIDIGDAVISSATRKDYYADLLPVTIALRAMFGKACWHNPFPAGCVVIDDPLLRRRYGFFDYDQVISAIEAEGYSTTIAFIPRNFRRSHAAIVSKVITHGNRISICVHGCDHADSEFGGLDAASLENKAATALERMRKHQLLTKLPFDRVMVFPKGSFSSLSIRALQKCGYLAAVNSGPQPTDHVTAPISICDLFDLAILRFAAFPIFTRQYPNGVFGFAVDLLWGKPVIIVEHHDYFRNGVQRLNAFIRTIKQLDGRIEWLTLEKALQQSAKYKLVRAGEYEVRFVTATFRLRNPLESRCKFRCSKLERDMGDVLGVRVDGQEHAYAVTGDRVCLEVDLESRGERTIQINYKLSDVQPHKMALAYQGRVFLRRRLSELRDNYLSKNERLFALIKALIAKFRGHSWKILF